jgi:PAS domain-containing protein
MFRDDDFYTPVSTTERVPSERELGGTLVLLPHPPEPLPMLWSVDRRLTTLGVNVPFADLFGADPTDLIGQPWFAMMTADARDSLSQLVAVGVYQAAMRVQLRRPDGAAVAVTVRRLDRGPGRRSASFRVQRSDERHREVERND